MRCLPNFCGAIATSLVVFTSTPPIWAELPPDLKISQQDTTNPLPQMASLIYVSPLGNSTGDGSPNNPYPSITAAIASKPLAGTVIQLNQGLYNAQNGEVFPIQLPAGVTLRGEPSNRGGNILISGSGKFTSPSFASQNITLLANDDVRIEGVSVTNPETRGTALWLESGKRVSIANNTFMNSNREGIFLTGSANAVITDNIFKKNGANGLSAVGSSTGEIRNNTFENTGFGIAIGQRSQVLVSNNNILNNVDGIIISNLAAPTLRNNLISDNKRNGIAILKDRKGYPTPDLGTSANLGKNIFRNNLGKDLNNNSGVTQVAVGNELNPKKVAGKVAFVGDAPATPAPEVAATPLPPVARVEPPTASSGENPTVVEITRSPQPIFNAPIIPPRALPPSQNSILIEPLPGVPPTVANAPSTKPTPVVTPQKLSPKSSPSANPQEILIDRDPVPVIPPQTFKNPTSPRTTTAVSIIPESTVAPIPNQVAYNPRIAALVPLPAKESVPYLVVIPSDDEITLSRVRSAVPSAKLISSRFGNIIKVQGYPDRDRAEVLRIIMKSEIGLDARVVHQNSL
ncbi:MAG: hypothetical protein DCE90_14320 [Pseudanabaena sp.]|nr:MAG: hypothetical protein DCE90_14320 [Pseudanabaena sp.]